MTTVKHPPRLIAAELVLLLLTLLIFPPYSSSIPAPLSNEQSTAHRNVNVAIGVLQTGVYPSFSGKFYEIIFHGLINDPESIARKDLRTLLPSSAWPSSPQEPFFFRGMESGTVWLLLNWWKLTDRYTLQSACQLFIVLHLLAVFALFFALSSMRVTGLAYVGSIFLAYSPVHRWMVLSLSHYAFPTIFACWGGSLIALDQSWNLRFRKRRFILWICLSALMALGTQCRVTVMLSYLACFISLFVLSNSSKDRVRLVVASVATFVLVTTVFQSIAFNKDRLQYHQRRVHLFWHSIWEGCGEFPNPYGFERSDLAASAFADSVKPGVIYASSEYESIMREHLLQSIAKDPIWYLGIIGKRIAFLGRNWTTQVPLGSHLVGWAALVALLAAFTVLGTSLRKAVSTSSVVLLPLGVQTLSSIFIVATVPSYNDATFLFLTLIFSWISLSLVTKLRLLRLRKIE